MSAQKNYLVTERAHLMCPNMQFAIFAEIAGEYSYSRIEETLLQQSRAHPFLCALVAEEPETERYYYRIADSTKVALTETTEEPFSIMQTLSAKDWNPFENGLLKVYAYPKRTNTVLLFVAHHLLCDGRGLLQLVAEFADCYSKGTAPAFAEERLIQSGEDLPQGSALPWISKRVFASSSKKWKKEGKKVSYAQYAAFAEQYGKTHPVSYSEEKASTEEYRQLIELCRQNAISVNDYLTARFCLENNSNKVMIAADIRKDLSCYQKNALGNYATVVTLLLKQKTVDLIQKAKEIHSLMAKSMADNKKKFLVLSCYLDIEPALLDAAAISALGGFESAAGAFVGGKLFGMSKPLNYSVTNLGRIESDTILSASFIPAASPAVKRMLGVLTVNDKMSLCESING